ncbi:MAG: hypothetical protein J0L56_15565 [Chitinophagales bacterium]|nr:hypothetical protein [Chitinophagales bacterium]
MMCPATRRFMVIVTCLLLVLTSLAQPDNDSFKQTIKPYRILTSGKQVTVKSTKLIKNIMVWTASGHRIVEQREVKASTFNFNVPAKENICFIMIQYDGMKPFTEKVGVR